MKEDLQQAQGGEVYLEFLLSTDSAYPSVFRTIEWWTLVHVGSDYIICSASGYTVRFALSAIVLWCVKGDA